jgi:glycosyltransferase involved in cell wall biosynthesis
MPAPKISIIIPVYNAASYLEQCIRSALNQSMQETEIIAVNDGSNDDSKMILDQLAATDQRLKVFHNSNRGVSATRNFGLQKVTGEYISFCDADDFMEPTMLAKLYQSIQQNYCDWAICNVNELQEGKQTKTRLNLTDQVLDISNNKEGFVHGLMRFHFDNANWNKLYNTSIIRQNKICFAEDMQIWEDLLFNLQYLQYAKRVAVIAKPLYNYRIISTALFSGQGTDLLPQFNRLYDHYVQFVLARSGVKEAEAFKEEMARIIYYQLLWKAEVKLKREQQGFFKILNAYTQELKRFNPAIFYYPSNERKGVQGIKKQLLQNHSFRLFSFIIAAKPFLKRPYRFVRKLLSM